MARPKVTFIYMYYVYVLGSFKDKGLYIGYTNNLKRRFSQHNSGLSKSTSHRRPLVLLYYEAIREESDAKSREKYLKSGYGRKQLNSILRQTIRNFLKNSELA